MSNNIQHYYVLLVVPSSICIFVFLLIMMANNPEIPSIQQLVPEFHER